MKKVMGCLTLIGVLALLAGFFVQRHAKRIETEYRTFDEALALFYSGKDLYRAGKLEEAEKKFQELSVRINAHKNDSQWQKGLSPYVQYPAAFIAYHKSLGLWERYVRIYTTRSNEPIPDVKEVLAGLETFQKQATALIGNPAFSAPEVAWRLKNDRGNAITWQLVVRWAMEEAKFEELKPYYDAALPDFKSAMPLAEEASRSQNVIGETETSPVLVVSQNLDFMTRLNEAMEKQQQPQPKDGEKESEGDENKAGKPRRGLGDFLSAGKAQKQNPGKGFGQMLSGKGPSDSKFLPLPMKGIGTSRLPGIGTK